MVGKLLCRLHSKKCPSDDEYQRWIDVLRQPHGKKGVTFTGARTRSQTRATSHLRCGFPRDSTLVPVSLKVACQETGKFCVQNSMLNLCAELRTDACERILKGLGEAPLIHSVSQKIRANPKSFGQIVIKKVRGVPDYKILEYLTMESTSGKYLLPTGNLKNCIAIDADSHCIMESDPEHPWSLPLTMASFAKINDVPHDLKALIHFTHKQ